MDKATALELTGGLSAPSKMPGHAYGIPAQACKVGGALREVPGSTCSKCYALKGRYVMPNVKAKQAYRLASIAGPHWVEAMVWLIVDAGDDAFRWHDAGDLQDLTHLADIVEVCRMTPEVKHYLPTRERAIVLSYLRQFGAFPANLAVRLSAAMIDAPPPVVPAGALTSTVYRDKAHGFACPARKQGNQCRSCRACWDRSVPSIAYPLH